MPDRRALVLSLALIGLAIPAIAQEEPRSGGGETLDVEIKIVPFYAVDTQGRPVFDLRPEEVELRVDGNPVAVDTFDRYSAVGARPAGKGEAPSSPPPAAAAARQVFLLFDVAFSSPRGLNSSRQLAAGLLERLPATDRLYLLTNDTRTGFSQVLGPLAADDRGKRKLLDKLRSVQFDIARLDTDAAQDLGPTSGGTGRNGVPMSQMVPIYDAARSNAFTEYAAFARDLAESLEILAANLRRISAPKLLVVFSQGVDDALYFEGLNGPAVGSTEAIRVNTRRFSPLLTHFEGPLAALAEANVMSLFVNTGSTAAAVGGGNTLRHMAEATGGRYLGGSDLNGIEDRIADSTAAYYEAGFYPAASLRQAARAGVEVVVRRPGVKVWAPEALKIRESYESLTPTEKRLLVLDLVEGDIEAQRARGPVRLDARNLSGTVVGRAATGKRLLRYNASWPSELAGREVDLYSVALVPTRQKGSPKVLKFDRQERVRLAAAAPLEVEKPAGQGFIWGIVAVEPATGRAWYRRLLLKAD